MGYMNALIMAKRTDMMAGLEWHLTGNHYPPVPLSMLEPAKKAIELCREDDFDGLVETPYPHRKYGYKVPAGAIVKSLHLEPWIGKFIDDYV